MDLDDPFLRSGYENCIRYMIRDLSVTVEELKACGPAGSCAGAGAVRGGRLHRGRHGHGEREV